MTIVDRWLLPEGIEEILPDRAIKIERLRRRLLDLYHSWGYDLVIPPLAEFTESLLSGVGADLDLITCKIIDQLSGRMMGVRADITPQAARMDAHSMVRDGPNRLCYAGQVLYSRPKNQMESRSPILLGVELFGEAGLEADAEVILLLVETLKNAGIHKIHLDLGHVGIYRELEAGAGLNEVQRGELFELLQNKDASLDKWVDINLKDHRLAEMIRALPGLTGSVEVLEIAEKALAEANDPVGLALKDIRTLVHVIGRRSIDVNIYLDLAELRGYHYHTGAVFAAYAEGALTPLGNGGRYDHVGDAFGRARPATGFGVDLGLLAAIAADEDNITPGIFVPPSDDEALLGEVARLREQGERVVFGFRDQIPDYAELNCNRQLLTRESGFAVVPISDLTATSEK